MKQGDILNMMASLRDDPDEMRRRKAEIEEAIRREEDEEPKSRRLLVDVELDPPSAKMYRIVEIFLDAMRGGKDPEETLKYVLMSGLDAEMERFGLVRDKVIASIGEVAERTSSETASDEDRKIVETPSKPSPQSPSASDYWRAGYVTTRCPRCGGQAFWHPDKKDLDCRKEGPIGEFEEMPRGKPKMGTKGD